MNKITRYKESLIFTVVIILFALFFQSTLERIDDSFTDIKFNFRGKQQIDTSIVTLFFTDDDLQTLGGLANLPNHTALIISALNNLGAKAIGINILFDEQINYQGSERRHFISTVKSSPKVSLACYFQNIGEIADSLKNTKGYEINSEDGSDSTKFKLENANLPIGYKMLSPYPKLIDDEQIGHLNYYGKTVARKIPLLVKSNSGKTIPSFSLELIRVYLGIPKDSIFVSDNEIILHSEKKKIKIPAENGGMLINYSGSSENLQKFTAVNFLNAYINYITNKATSLPLESFKNKIVLIAIDSKVLGQYLINPFNERMPILGVQANGIDTILRNRFIYEFSPWIVYFFSFIFVFIICYLLLRSKVAISFFISLLLLVAYIFLSFYLFSENIQLPVHPILLAPLAIVFSLLYKFGIVHKYSEKMEESTKNDYPLKQKDSEKIDIIKNKLIDSEIKNAQQTKLNYVKEEKAYLMIEDNNRIKSKIDFNKIDFKEVTKEFKGIVFDVNSQMSSIVDVIKKIAPSNAAVLITGESGTGKELIAAAIHSLSNRSEKTYVALNCATLQETLLESELFGYEKGAFTGADKQKIGLFETANFSTLFLDEISEMSENLQSKLLRVLQSNEFFRVGGTVPIKVDVRIIAATNKDPQLEIKAKRFREDLFYRLNTIHIELAPLRKRKADIPILINNFLNKQNKIDFDLSKDVFDVLLNYNWPGNVRQLESVVERAVIFAEAESRNEITIKDLPAEFSKNDPTGELEEKILSLLRIKKFSRNSINETAKELGGLNRGTITEYLRGILLRELLLNNYNIDKASVQMAGTNEPEVINYVKKKNEEYLLNIQKHINKSSSLEKNINQTKMKYKNLPKRYHVFLESYVRHLYS